MKLKDRVDKTFDRYGDDFLINGAIPGKGFFQRADGALMSAYFPAAGGAARRPVARAGLVVMVPAETPAAVNDRIARDGRTYTVARVSEQCVNDTRVMRIFLLK